MANRCFKMISKPWKADFRQLRPKFQGAPSHRNWRFTMKRNHFKTVILSDWRIILQNYWRFLFLTCYRTIKSLSFPTGISYSENWIHLWALIFGSQNFHVLHMFLKYKYLENGNEFQEIERGVCSKNTNIKKPILVYTQVSQIWRTKCISEPQFLAVWPNF